MLFTNFTDTIEILRGLVYITLAANQLLNFVMDTKQTKKHDSLQISTVLLDKRLGLIWKQRLFRNIYFIPFRRLSSFLPW